LLGGDHAAKIKHMVKQGIAQRKLVYEKPTLRRLGLLRLMTKWSHSGDEQGNHDGNHNHQD
jgi:hypothetical protein